MENMKREYLKKGDTLLLRRGENPTAEPWRITGLVGEGGCSVCYTAVCGEKSGRLKECYPAETIGGKVYDFFMERTKENQLVARADKKEKFQEMRADFIRAYHILETAKQANSRNEVLKNFIPPYELLYGAETVYVWTPDDKIGDSFETYLSQVRKHPKIQPETKLYKILGVLLTLADCIKALHGAGLIHLDIKPSNFLVPYNSAFDLNVHTISLFDVNTLHALESRLPRIAGTEGYQAPEVKRGRGENRSDIYSIGAVLFSAIILTEEIPDGLYRGEYYGQIDQLVASSALIRASEVNDTVFLKHWLATILKKTLANRPADRYGSCEELMADLEKAQTFLLPAVKGKHLGLHQTLAVVEKETNCNPTAVLQQMLFQDPLYDWLPEGEKEIRVLVVGAGSYGQKFMDLCLQTGQMKDHALHITALSEDPALDQEIYLQFRPALQEFVDLDGSLTQGEAYAHLDFRSVPEDGLQSRGAAELILRETACQYIFVSLGEDGLNETVAAAFADGAKKLGMDCAVHFVVQDGEKQDFAKGQPVFINAPITPKTIDPELERMAFQVHLAWSGQKNGDLRLLRRQFREKYNYLSSMAYALSIPYKLKSIGIPMENMAETARLFGETVLQEKGEAFRELAALEHRRWVMEKVTDGWAAPRNHRGELDLAGCIRRGSVKDKGRKLHPCIVPSTAATPLLETLYLDGTGWDMPSHADETLDELDRLSVELHRLFQKEAEAFRRILPLHQGDAALLRPRLAGKGEAVLQACDRYLFCLKQILEGSRTYAAQYDAAEKHFREALEGCEEALKRELTARLQQIRRDFFPVIESNLYRDYKSYDGALIEKIPHILTAKPQPYLVQAFAFGEKMNGNDLAFQNVTPAMTLQAGKNTYLYYFDETADADQMLTEAKHLLDFFAGRRVQISFLIGLTAGEETKAKLEQGFAALPSCSVTIWDCADISDAASKLQKALQRRRIDFCVKETPLFSDTEQNEAFWENLKIPPAVAEREIFLQVADLFTLAGKEQPEARFPEFATEYETLWEIYKEAGYARWSRLCHTLADYSRKQDILGETPLKRAGKQNLPYFSPAYGKNEVETLLEQLFFLDIGEEGSALSEELVSLLQTLCEKQFLYRLGGNGFVYPSLSVKKLLTDGAELLRVYGYYEISKAGCFDDALWCEDGCILTKGMQSLFVAFGEKTEGVHALAEEIGIGAKKVRVSPFGTEEDGVFLLKKEEELEKIGEILAKIMEERR